MIGLLGGIYWDVLNPVFGSDSASIPEVNDGTTSTPVIGIPRITSVTTDALIEERVIRAEITREETTLFGAGNIPGMSLEGSEAEAIATPDDEPVTSSTIIRTDVAVLSVTVSAQDLADDQAIWIFASPDAGVSWWIRRAHRGFAADSFQAEFIGALVSETTQQWKTTVHIATFDAFTETPPEELERLIREFWFQTGGLEQSIARAESVTDSVSTDRVEGIVFEGTEETLVELDVEIPAGPPDS